MRTILPTHYAQDAKVPLNESMCSFVTNVDRNLTGISSNTQELSARALKENNFKKDVTFCLNETY